MACTPGCPWCGEKVSLCPDCGHVKHTKTPCHTCQHLSRRHR